MNRLTPYIISLALAAALLLTGCRRDLWVYGDEFSSLTLDVDWSEYQSSDPDGMTCWFFPKDERIQPSRLTTAYVRHTKLYLGLGRYTGVVIDYSPQEYSRQEFVGMDRASTACVQVTPANFQPDANSPVQLYGPECFHQPLPATLDGTNFYEVMNQPEQMALDTLQDMVILSGGYDEYVPYEERDYYQSSLVMQEFYSTPTSPIWKMRISIYVKGIDYLWTTEGTLAGLATGRFLALNRNTDVPCLLRLDEWSVQRTGNNEGYITCIVNNFGLCGSQHPYRCYDDQGNDITPAADGSRAATRAYAGNQVNWEGTRTVTPDDLQLNLMLLLRDQSTKLYYHFKVGEYVVSYDNQLVLRLDLDSNTPGYPDLPYVDAYESAGFGAVVTPWEDGGSADVSM